MCAIGMRLGQRVHGLPDLDGAFAQQRIRAAGQHRIGTAVAYLAESIANSST